MALIGPYRKGRDPASRRNTDAGKPVDGFYGWRSAEEAGSFPTYSKERGAGASHPYQPQRNAPADARSGAGVQEGGRGAHGPQPGWLGRGFARWSSRGIRDVRRRHGRARGSAGDRLGNAGPDDSY